MSQEIAWQIEQTFDGETYTDYVRSDEVAGSLIEDDQFDVTIVGYEDTRSEWDKMMTLARFGEDIDIEINHGDAVEAMDFEAIAEHYDDGTADELERVGTNWDEASEAERMAFILLVEKLQKMAQEARRLLDQKYWGFQYEGRN